ncbi:putative 39S ribosomal protein L49, mitochondrial [Chionoecetes opilio]|uniref:Large ribosomal subunit protein mL49 n=1 Tax=Chionoecetes opilio TaxID=41210 RepID=A0A8J4YMU8_CHIOP|nr:putative 39S ribosomal protein L49, mitochondrial [Chionoecetes opilio]
MLSLRQVSRLGWRTIISPRALHTSPPVSAIGRLPAGTHTIPEGRDQVETSRAEWGYVERLFPPKTVPRPQATPGEVKPSGWVAPSASRDDHPYFVPRNRSHMLPVYLEHKPIISKYRTSVHHVEGDIFALLEELREYLKEQRQPKILNMRAHEPHQRIEVKGQYVAEVREFLLQKGF